MKKALIVLAALIGLLLATLVVAWAVLRHPLPEATAGPAGDELAHRVAASVGAEAWDRLPVVRWTIGGNRRYLWDKAHGFVRVRLGEDEVLLDLMKMDGRAFRAGEEQSGAEKQKLIDRAYKLFCNDSFWLNPLVKLFDAGTSRAALQIDGKPALLVSYASGGVTPGDKYLWLLDESGRPRAWRVYAQVLKRAPGIEFTWEGWQRIGAGAEVATSHGVAGLLHVQPVTELAGADHPEELEPGPDPFTGLASKR